MLATFFPRSRSGRALTSLADQQKEPHAARQVDEQRQRVRRAPEQVDHSENRFQDLLLQPAVGWVVERGMRRRLEMDGCTADEGRCQAPCHAD